MRKILHDVPFWVAYQLMTFVDKHYHDDVKILFLTYRTTFSIKENKTNYLILEDYSDVLILTDVSSLENRPYTIFWCWSRVAAIAKVKALSSAQ